VLSLAHLRTFFTASFVALVIVACGGGGSGSTASPSETPPSDEQQSDDSDSSPEPITELDANSIGVLRVEFLEEASGYPHASHIPTQTVPEVGRNVVLSVSFSDKPEDIQFSVVDRDGRTLDLIQPDEESESEFYYVGSFDIPEQVFLVKASGFSEKLGSFAVTLSAEYSSESPISK